MLIAVALGVYINMGAGINGAGTTYMGEKRAWLEEMDFAGVRQDIHWDPDVWTRAASSTSTADFASWTSRALRGASDELELA